MKDAVWTLSRLLDRPGAVGEIFNVGGNEEVSMAEVAHRVKEALNSSALIVYVPYAEAYEEGFDDMQRRVPDISKVARLASLKT